MSGDRPEILSAEGVDRITLPPGAELLPDKSPGRRRHVRPPRPVFVLLVAALIVLAGVIGAGVRTTHESPATQPPATAAPVGVLPSLRGPATNATPIPTSDPSIAQLIKPLVPKWRPQDPTVIVTQRSHSQGSFGSQAHTLVAIPAAGGAAVPLIANLPEPGNWDLRRDGSALVVALQAGQAAPRLAIWDLQTGVLRWISPDGAGAILSPRWSPDGTFVYFGQYSLGTPPEPGLFRVRADGTDLQPVPDPLPRGKLGAPQLVTDDGVLFLIRANQGREGGTLAALDLASGRASSVGGCMELQSWRPAQPRAILQTAACGAIGTRLFILMLWNDVSGVLLPLTGPTKEFSQGADWDPSGTRIVASLRGTTGTELPEIITMDPDGAARTRLAGTENGRYPLWLRAGIAYVSSGVLSGCTQCSEQSRPPYEVQLIAPAGGAPKALYRSDDEIVGIRVVGP